MKKEATMRRLISFFVGAVMGGLVGATAAVLLAPSSGNDLRQQLRERGIKLQVEVKAAAAARRAELEDQLATLRAPRRIE
jgi:gas vesicle protein